MTASAVELVAIEVDAHDPEVLARFWAGLLGWSRRATGSTGVLVRGEVAFGLRFVGSRAAKQVANQMHLDLTSTGLDDQREIVERALDLGGRHLDVGQRPEDGHVVLADPEGNELCVIEPGNGFLAGTGAVGCVAGDGTRAVGRFWSAALGWPLVWDQDEETAVQSPAGGTKLSWGGPPLAPRADRNRWRFQLATSHDVSTATARLVSLGASVISEQAGRAVCRDPDGNEFAVTAAPAQL